MRHCSLAVARSLSHSCWRIFLQRLSGIAVDAANRIYVADEDNYRIVRVDNMSGAGWTTLGTQGLGRSEFVLPRDIFIDAAGRIYILDQFRVVRMNDMAGSGWIEFGRKGARDSYFKLPEGFFVH